MTEGQWWTDVQRYQREVVPASSALLEAGAQVGWFTKRRVNGRRVTTGFSPAHRAGGDGRTLCLKPIPDASQLLGSSLLSSAAPCYTCLAAYAHGMSVDQMHDEVVQEIASEIKRAG